MKKSILSLAISTLIILSSCSCGMTQQGSIDPKGKDSTEEFQPGSQSSSSTSQSSSGSSSSEEHNNVYSINLVTHNLNLDLFNNPTYQFHPVINCPDQTPIVSWSVSDTSILSISSNGLVTALSTGQTTVRACFEINKTDYFDTCIVNVSDSTPDNPYINSVSISGNHNPTLNKGDTTSEYQVNVSGHDGDTNYSRKVSFDVENTEVVQLNEIQTGANEICRFTVTAKRGGTSRITATSLDDPTKSDYIIVNVNTTITSLVSLVSYPSTVGLNKSVDPNDVTVEALLDDGHHTNVTATNVQVDTSSVGIKTATVSVAGVSNTLNFEIEVIIVQPTFIDLYIDESYVQSGDIHILTDKSYDFEFEVTVDENATYTDYEWYTNWPEYIITETNNNTIHINPIPLSSGIEHLYVYVQYVNNHVVFSRMYEFKLVDGDSEYLIGIEYEYNLEDIVNVQYAGQLFDDTGFSFYAVYANTDDKFLIYPTFGELEIGKPIVGRFTQMTTGLVATVTIPENLIEIRKNNLTINIIVDESNIQKSFSINSPTWDTTHQGIQAHGVFDSGDNYFDGFYVSFSPETPAAMGEGENQKLTVIFTAKTVPDASNSVDIYVDVYSPSEDCLNSTGLPNGNYYIGNGTKFVTQIVDGVAKLGSKENAMPFTFTLASDDKWYIRNGGKNLYLTSTEITFINESLHTNEISWYSQKDGTRIISYGAVAISDPGNGNELIMSRLNNANYGLMLTPVSDIVEITSISGKTSARANKAWSTDEIVVMGKFENNPIAKNISSFVDIVFDPASSNDPNIDSVNVSAYAKNNHDVKLEDVPIECEIKDTDIWEIARTFDIGDKVIIGCKASHKCLSELDYYRGLAVDFDKTKENSDYVLTIREGSQPGTFAFEFDEGGYLSSYDYNTVVRDALILDKSSWRIDIDKLSGNVVIDNVEDINRHFGYYPDDNIFTTHLAGNISIQLYKQVD